MKISKGQSQPEIVPNRSAFLILEAWFGITTILVPGFEQVTQVRGFGRFASKRRTLPHKKKDASHFPFRQAQEDSLKKQHTQIGRGPHPENGLFVGTRCPPTEFGRSLFACDFVLRNPGCCAEPTSCGFRANFLPGSYFNLAFSLAEHTSIVVSKHFAFLLIVVWWLKSPLHC